jgi:hypothetical protein
MRLRYVTCCTPSSARNYYRNEAHDKMVSVQESPCAVHFCWNKSAQLLRFPVLENRVLLYICTRTHLFHLRFSLFQFVLSTCQLNQSPTAVAGREVLYCPRRWVRVPLVSCCVVFCTWTCRSPPKGPCLILSNYEQEIPHRLIRGNWRGSERNWVFKRHVIACVTARNKEKQLNSIRNVIGRQNGSSLQVYRSCVQNGIRERERERERQLRERRDDWGKSDGEGKWVSSAESSLVIDPCRQTARCYNAGLRKTWAVQVTRLRRLANCCYPLL